MYFKNTYFKLKTSEYFVLSISALLDLSVGHFKRDASGGCAGALNASPVVEYSAVC